MKKSNYGIIQDTNISDRIYTITVYVSIWLCIAVVIFPILNIISSSISNLDAVFTGKVLFWPVGFSLEGYKLIFTSKYILSGFNNSVIYTVFGTIINVVMTMMAAYPLSRKDLRCRNFVMLIFAFTMLFNGGMIPTYLVVKNLHITDTIWGILLPSAISVWNLIVTRTYIQSNIPDELYESASLDGCSDIKFLIRIVVPLSTPILAVITLLYAVGRWNSFFDALIYLNKITMMPLQIVLRDILINGGLSDMALDASQQEYALKMKYLLQYALIIVSSVPLLLLYPFIQRYFIKGIMIGAIKG